jgi:hypothetical protein
MTKFVQWQHWKVARIFLVADGRTPLCANCTNGDELKTVNTQVVYMYNGESSWERRADMPIQELQKFTCVALDTQRALICGGEVLGSNEATRDCYIYTASTDEWTMVAQMAHARSGHSMVMFNGET